MKAAIVALASTIVAVAGAAEIDFSYCATCHGAQGNGNPAIRAPKIAGIEPWYLKRQLEAFRAGWRGMHPEDAPGNEMRPMAVRLADDAAIAKALAHVATWSPKDPRPSIKGDVTRGKQLYSSCAACHGAKGEGNEKMNAPALARRTDWYLLTQLENYRAGLRGTEPKDTFGTQMRAASAALPDGVAAVDVVAYINTLP